MRGETLLIMGDTCDEHHELAPKEALVAPVRVEAGGELPVVQIENA